MPIISIKHDQLLQRCAPCDNERWLSAAGLADEILPEGLPFVLRLARCPCGAVEHLLHSPDDEPEHPGLGGPGHLHRLLVDALLNVLTSPPTPGTDSPPLESRVAAELGPTLLARWFPEGLLTTPRATVPEGTPLPIDTTKDTP